MVSSEAVKATVAVVLLLQSIGVWGALHDITVEGGGDVHWDYSYGPYGPAHWGELKPEWAVCKTGKQQSPLSVAPEDRVWNPKLEPLVYGYHFDRTPATIANEGHAVVVEFPSNKSSGYMSLNSEYYRLRQFHYHMPGEHHIGGHSYPLEIHQVYKTNCESPQGGSNIAVVSFLFYQAPSDSEFLAQFVDKIPEYGSPSMSLGNITMLEMSKSYGRYIGSLTTPPCTEGVIWTIDWELRPASKRQLEKLQAALPHFNNRPTFPSAGRGFGIKQ